jgi:hypothetical protein
MSKPLRLTKRQIEELKIAIDSYECKLKVLRLAMLPENTLIEKVTEFTDHSTYISVTYITWVVIDSSHNEKEWCYAPGHHCNLCIRYRQGLQGIEDYHCPSCPIKLYTRKHGCLGFEPWVSYNALPHRPERIGATFTNEQVGHLYKHTSAIHRSLIDILKISFHV